MQGLIPDAVKTKTDAVAVGTGLFAYFTWSELAGLFSCIYLGIRIFFYLWDRYKGRKPEE